ncbi:HAD family hydrolase [Patescibacteria group bacterium]|nr:MAG: HAD family hydrolase [Patescibacteria group bacterium]
MSPAAITRLKPEVIKQPFWSLPPGEVLTSLETSTNGLDEAEAKRRLQTFGPNAIAIPRRLPRLRIVANQFKSPLILALLAAGGVMIAFRDWIDAGAIFITVAVNTALGFWQENKAETVLAGLLSYVRTRARVRRAGVERELDAAELAPGDVIRIAQGDRVPADARLLFVNNLEVDEAILTGEALPVTKSVEAVPVEASTGDRLSMVMDGTLVVRGFGDAVVTATGLATEFGRIAKLVTHKGQEPTPLQRAVSRFAAWAGAVLTLLVAALFTYGVAIGWSPLEMFLIAVAVAVSAIPEGLPVALTVILAVGVERLAKRKAIVRKLLAAESLGSTTVILTDKTGTLTQAKITLSSIHPLRGKGSEAERELLQTALANTDIALENPGDPPSAWRLVGRPLEAAIVRAAAERGLVISKAAELSPLRRLPFDSEKKYSAALVHIDGKRMLLILGAPEILAAACRLEDAGRRRLLLEVEAEARAGARVLGVARLTGGNLEALQEQLPLGCDFEGYLVFHDPLRPGVKSAIERIGRAGVRTVIVTGDHPGTALAVAHSLGLANGTGSVLTGAELAVLSPDDLLGRLPNVGVFARVTPEQKVLITKLFQARGEVVAVTGDGVNDAPALSSADIGVAVGSGTDVAKGASDLVIVDDNFETIVAAIEEGRRILGNVRKVIVYLLSNSLNELFLIGGSLAAGLALPLNALQILFVNFFSDSFPAIAFAFETGRGGGLRPRARGARLFDAKIRFLILVVGTVGSFFLFALYWSLLRAGFPGDIVRTFIFGAFATYTLLLAFSLRSMTAPITSYNPFANRALSVGVGIGIALTLLAIYHPWLNVALRTTPLPLPWLAAVGAVGLVNLALVEAVKIYFRRR